MDAQVSVNASPLIIERATEGKTGHKPLYLKDVSLANVGDSTS